MAFDAFLKIDGIEGEQPAEGAPGRDRDLVLQLGRDADRQRRSGGGGGAGKVQMQDFHFAMS